MTCVDQHRRLQIAELPPDQTRRIVARSPDQPRQSDPRDRSFIGSKVLSNDGIDVFGFFHPLLTLANIVQLFMITFFRVVHGDEKVNKNAE